MSQVKKIPCSVGILTYNSEKYIRRALESVKDFTNVIVSDGGSTDKTLEIAAEYGCTVIDQYTKSHPSESSFHPIEDFARERNILIDQAKEDWFLWIDSDEYISKELHEEIREVCSTEENEHHAYLIPLVMQSPDATITYKRLKNPKQIRFFNLKTEGRFERFIHERFVFDKKKYRTGEMKGAWYVPIRRRDLKEHSKVVNYRFRKMLAQSPRITLSSYLRKAWYRPIKTVFISLIYMVINNVLYFKKAPPFFYYRNSLYSQWVIFKIVNQSFFKSMTSSKDKNRLNYE